MSLKRREAPLQMHCKRGSSGSIAIAEPVALRLANGAKSDKQRGQIDEL
jgi:hypothetical protein